MKLFLLGISTALCAAIAVAGHAKTVAQCNAEYATNKASIRASGERKRDFLTRCRAETAAITGPLPPKGDTAAAPSASTQNQPAERRTARVSGVPTRANEFATEAEAKAHCPGDAVVWANTRSKIYHSAETRSYGNTKAGAYVCERDTAGLGFQAAKNERRRRPTG